MAQEIVTWCDVCMREDQKVPGSAVVIALNHMKPKALDLCETHVKELVDPLWTLLEEEARPLGGSEPTIPEEPSKPKKDSDYWTEALECLVEGCDYSTRRRGSMREHTMKEHDTTLPRLETIHGATIDGKRLKHTCPYCDPKVMFSHGAGMATHVRQTHAEESQEATLLT